MIGGIALVLILFSLNGWAAATVDVNPAAYIFSTTSNSATESGSFDATCSGTNCKLIVDVSYGDNSGATCTYNSVSMNEIGESPFTSTRPRLIRFELDNPTTGSNTLACTFGATGVRAYAIAYVLKDAGTVSAVTASNYSNQQIGTGTDPIVTQTLAGSAAGNLMLCTMVNNNNLDAPTTVSGDFTELVEVGTGTSDLFVIGTYTTAGTATYTCTMETAGTGNKNIFIIEVAEETGTPPILENKTKTLAENSANGTTVVDYDDTVTGDDTDMTYAEVADECTIFSINTSTGVVTIGDNTLMDYERFVTCTGTFSGTNSGGSDNATLTLTLTDVAGDSDYSTIYYEDSFEDDSCIIDNDACPTWEWDNDALVGIPGSGEMYERSTTQKVAGSSSLRLNFDGRNGIHNECQNHFSSGEEPHAAQTAATVLIDDDGDNLFRYFTAHDSTTDGTTASKLVDSSKDFTDFNLEAGWVVVNDTDVTETTVVAVDDANTLSLADDIFTSGEDYRIFAPVAYVYNMTDSQVRWEVTSYADENATNDKLTFTGGAPDRNETGGAGDFDAGDNVRYYAKCNSLAVANKNTKSDCDTCINYFEEETYATEWALSSMICRRQYLYLDSGATLPGNTLKIGYWKTSGIGEGSLKIDVSGGREVTVNINGTNNTGIILDLDKWYYTEECRLRETAAGSNGSLRLYVAEKGSEASPTVYEEDNYTYGTGSTLSQMGNFQNTNVASGFVYFDDVMVANGRIGAVAATTQGTFQGTFQGIFQGTFQGVFQ